MQNPDPHTMILPGATLGMLGGGQLGRMFTLSARTMGYRVIVLDPDPDSPAGQVADRHLLAPYLDRQSWQTLESECAAITTEFENIPVELLQHLAKRLPVRPGAHTVAIAQNRETEKSWLRANGFETAPFAIVGETDGLEAACRATGFPAVLKVARFGYDGKGQVRVANLNEARAAFAELGSQTCVLEQLLDLRLELSVVLGRNAAGQNACFPVAENIHRDGILDTSIAPARVDPALAARARAAALHIAQQLDYCGVLGVEFFVTTDDRLLVNELAPRPHNSGHFTLDACLTSQFELQVRALCNLPLGATVQHSAAVMINLLGDAWGGSTPDWLPLVRHPEAKLHLYGKREARPGRKMGHYTCLAETVDGALALAEAIRAGLRPRG